VRASMQQVLPVVMPTFLMEMKEDKDEDAGNYETATRSFNLNHFIILTPFCFVSVVLDSCRCDLCASVVVSHVT